MGIVPRRYDEPKQPLRLGANPSSKELGYAAGQLGFTLGGNGDQSINTEVTLTNLSLNIIVGANRRLKITVKGSCFSDTVDAHAVIRLKEDGVLIGSYVLNRLNGTQVQSYQFSSIITPITGTRTYIATGVKTGGTNVFHRSAGSDAGFAYLLVEDIGAA